MILSITQLFIAVFIVVKREDFIYLFPAKEPQTLRDLAYDRDKRLGYPFMSKKTENESLIWFSRRTILGKAMFCY
jgi:hypothetical protein